MDIKSPEEFKLHCLKLIKFFFVTVSFEEGGQGSRSGLCRGGFFRPWTPDQVCWRIKLSFDVVKSELDSANCADLTWTIQDIYMIKPVERTAATVLDIEECFHTETRELFLIRASGVSLEKGKTLWGYPPAFQQSIFSRHQKYPRLCDRYRRKACVS